MAIPFVADAEQPWRQHDGQRPRPPVVTPSEHERPIAPPSDAIVLFNGTDLSQWQSPGGGVTKWKVENGAMLPTPDSGMIETRRSFGDVQLHLEWQSPAPPVGSGQGRGNSGVYLMGKYEIQILDSYQNETYADGQAAAIYGQHPPLVNACLPSGKWQTYDVVFHAPRFADDGSLRSPATMTVLHNGVLVQDHFTLTGGTMWLQTLPYVKHDDALPLSLQDHGNPVRFRNIWVRPLRAQLSNHDNRPPGMRSTDATDGPPLAQFTGIYRSPASGDIAVELHEQRLQATFFGMQFLLRRVGTHAFESLSTDMDFSFSEDAKSLTVNVMGEKHQATRE
jgi:hypothetical protein